MIPTLLRDVPFSAIYWRCYPYPTPTPSPTPTPTPAPNPTPNPTLTVALALPLTLTLILTRCVRDPQDARPPAGRMGRGELRNPRLSLGRALTLGLAPPLTQP